MTRTPARLASILLSSAALAGSGRVGGAPASLGDGGLPAVVLVSANAEWDAVRALFPRARYERTPFGECFVHGFILPGGSRLDVAVVHGGWGKTSAAASAQHAIDRWRPSLVVNLGTCGGFAGAIDRGAVVLAERTVIYDIIERMGDPDEAVRDYSTALDLSWLNGPPPIPVVRGTLVSADQDIDPTAVSRLRSMDGAVAGDWESGAIAWVARRNGVRVLILRGVTDLVGASGGEAYGHPDLFRANARAIMARLFDSLPAWLAAAGT